MDEFLSRIVKDRGVVLYFGVLSCCTLVWVGRVGGVDLGVSVRGMFEARQCVPNIPRHGDVDFLFSVSQSMVSPMYRFPAQSWEIV